MPFRHGGPHQSSFLISRRKMKCAVQMDNALSIFKKCDFAVYVKINNPDMISHRNNFLKYMGGQSHVCCTLHKLPLITSYMKENKCYHTTNENGCKCNKQIHLICPDAKCNAGICKKCYMTFDQDSTSYISPPSLPDTNNSISDNVMNNNNDIDDDSSISVNQFLLIELFCSILLLMMISLIIL